MKYSHADYMAEQLHRTLLALRAEYPTKMLADLAGCSASLLYSWSESAENAKARFVMALAAGLAERGDFRLIALMLPPGAAVTARSLDAPANGQVEDEVTDGTIALARAALGHRGHNPDAIADARRLLREAERRLEAEEALLRQAQNEARR